MVREPALQDQGFVPRVGVPHAEGLVPGGGGQSRTVGGPRDARDAPPVPADRGDDSSAGDVEDNDGVACGYSGEISAFGGECEVDEPVGAPVRYDGVVVSVMEEDGAV